MTTAQLAVTLADYRSRYDRARGQLDLLRRQAEEKAAALAATRANIDLWDRVRLLLTKTSEFAREQTVRQMESLVTMFLQAVMGLETISFHIVLGTFSGQPAAWSEVRSVYGEHVLQVNPEEAKGGGITDIVSLALRLAVYQLTGAGGLLVVDEPTKMLSSSMVEETEDEQETADDYQQNIGRFLRDVTAQFRWRVVLGTHSPVMAEAAEGVQYRVRQDRASGISEVTRIG